MDNPCSIARCKRRTSEPPALLNYVGGLKVSIFLCAEHRTWLSLYVAEQERQRYALNHIKVPWKEKPQKLSDQDRLHATAIRVAVRLLKERGLGSPQLGAAFARGMYHRRLVTRMAINKWEREASRTPADAVAGAAKALKMTRDELLDLARREPIYVVRAKRRRRRDFDRA